MTARFVVADVTPGMYNYAPTATKPLGMRGMLPAPDAATNDPFEFGCGGVYDSTLNCNCTNDLESVDGHP